MRRADTAFHADSPFHLTQGSHCVTRDATIVKSFTHIGCQLQERSSCRLMTMLTPPMHKKSKTLPLHSIPLKELDQGEDDCFSRIYLTSQTHCLSYRRLSAEWQIPDKRSNSSRMAVWVLRQHASLFPRVRPPSKYIPSVSADLHVIRVSEWVSLPHHDTSDHTSVRTGRRTR